jgi:hypothetical protein
MKTTHTMAIRATLLGVMLAGSAGVAMAQKVKPAGPPVSTRGAVKSNPKADKGQATAETARVAARERKAEKWELKSARGESKQVLKGIKLSPEEKKSVNDIEKKYDRQYKDLEKAADDAAKAGTPDAAVATKVTELRIQERMELRAALAPEHRADFDKNVGLVISARKS